jgi:hypothetical protein
VIDIATDSSDTGDELNEEEARVLRRLSSLSKRFIPEMQLNSQDREPSQARQLVRMIEKYGSNP